MERYKILNELGDGTCGSVYKAINVETTEIVAIKKMKRKFYVWEECINLREVKSLRRLDHPNVIKLLEIVRQNNELFFIFEYMEHNLYQIMKDRQSSFSEEEIRALMSQVLQGLKHVHKNGYVHRDLKPENLLVMDNIIKIADFGLARELSSAPPFTDYVSTRWYRAPEVLLQSSTYTPAVDMWAVGALMAELFILCPIFPGESEIDQLYKICCVLGPADWNAFPEATNISRLVDITYSDIVPTELSSVIHTASSEAIDLIEQLCSWNPLKRPSADQCLQHPFFHVTTWVPRPLSNTPQLSLGSEPNLELELWDFGKKIDNCSLALTLANPSAPNLEMISNTNCVKRDQDPVFFPGSIDHSRQSVIWSLFPSDHHASVSVEPSLSLSFSSIPNPSVGGGLQSARFSMETAVFGQPLLTNSSPLNRRSTSLRL